MFRSSLLLILIVAFTACEDDPIPGNDEEPGDLTYLTYNPEPYELMLPQHFPNLPIPPDNPMTVDGIELGRRLFYDPILSSDSTISCGSCHVPGGNFSDNLATSPGVDGITGTRSSMTLLNVGFNTNGFFWDGRVSSLEEQAIMPVENPIELHEDWNQVENKLKRHTEYPGLFRKAFGITNIREITRFLTVKAIAQFERTLVSSGQSKYDRVISGNAVFTDLELDGHDIFFDINPDRARHAECGHCHNAPLFTTNQYFNNGIDEVSDLSDFVDQGRGMVTHSLFDNGTFRVPSLRNIEFSGPYMHDGRFKSLTEVINHYTTGGHQADNLGAVLRPLQLTSYDREALIAFIKTLQDTVFLQNPMFQNPFE